MLVDETYSAYYVNSQQHANGLETWKQTIYLCKTAARCATNMKQISTAGILRTTPALWNFPLTIGIPTEIRLLQRSRIVLRHPAWWHGEVSCPCQVLFRPRPELFCRRGSSWGQCCVRAPLCRNASMPPPPPPFRLPAPTPGSAIEKGQLQSLTIGLKLAPPGISHQHHHWLLRVANTTTTATDDAGQPGWTSSTVFRCLRHKLIPVIDLINPSCSRQNSRKNNYWLHPWPSLFFFFRILPAEYNTGGCRSSRPGQEQFQAGMDWHRNQSVVLAACPLLYLDLDLYGYVDLGHVRA